MPHNSPSAPLTGLVTLFVCLLTAAPAIGEFRDPQPISSETTESTRPQLDFGANGAALAVWESKPAGIPGDPDTVQVRWIGPGGAAGPLRELAAGTTDFPIPNLALDEIGRGAIAWVDDGVDGVRVGRDGSFGPTVTLLDSLPAKDQLTDLEVAAGGDGVAVVTWVHYGKGRTLEVARLHPDGRVDEARLVSRRGRVDNPVPVVDQRGRATIVWQTRVGKRQVIKAARLNRAGEIRDLGRLSRKSRRNRAPDIALDARGGATVVWERFAKRSSIQAARISKRGRVSEIRNLARSKRNGFSGPRIATAARQTPRVAWERFERSPKILGATLDRRGRLQKRYAIARPSRPNPVDIVLDRSGIATVLWSDNPGGGSLDTYATAVDRRGRLGDDELVASDANRAELGIDPDRGRPGVIAETFPGSRIELALADTRQPAPVR